MTAAYEFYEQAENIIKGCCPWDLYVSSLELYCDKKIPLSSLQKMYTILKDSADSGDTKSAFIFAYLAERAAPGFDQSISIAIAYYKKVQKSENEQANEYVKKKIKDYAPRFELYKAINQGFPASIVVDPRVFGIIADYAFQTPEKLGWFKKIKQKFF